MTGKFKLKDYNYEFPGKNLEVEQQLDTEAPGTYYEYGDHFKDEEQGDLLAKVRNEEILSTNKIFHGKSDCRLFRTGFKFTLSEHYREDWNADFTLTRAKSRGMQHGLFAMLPNVAQKIPTYENVFEAIPAGKEYRPTPHYPDSPHPGNYDCLAGIRCRR